MTIVRLKMNNNIFVPSGVFFIFFKLILHILNLFKNFPPKKSEKNDGYLNLQFAPNLIPITVINSKKSSKRIFFGVPTSFNKFETFCGDR